MCPTIGPISWSQSSDFHVLCVPEQTISLVALPRAGPIKKKLTSHPEPLHRAPTVQNRAIEDADFI